MAAHLAQDLPTAREASSSIDASPLNAWYALQNLFGTLDVLFSTVSQAALLINLTLGNGLVASNHFALAEVAGAGMNGTITTDAVTNPKASGVGNSIIVLAICLAWPIVNQMLTSDLDHKSQYLPHIYVCTLRLNIVGGACGSVRCIHQQPTLHSHEDAV